MRDIFLEASPRLELGVRILQTLALPLGYDAVSYRVMPIHMCGAGDGVAACAATLRCEPASRVCDFIALHFVKRIPSPRIRKNSISCEMLFFLEASPRLELGVRILQTLALPLGYDAVSYRVMPILCVERETGFGPATFTLAR